MALTNLNDTLKELQAGVTALFAKYGARHSKADNEAIQAVHDNAVSLGAMCAKARAYGSALVVYKAADGYRWLGVVSNGFKDLDGENITSAAHREFVAYLDANPEAAPELWSWHTPGTARKARADWWDYTSNGFLWMSGPLTEAEAAPILADDTPLGMSHGFRGVKQKSDIVFYRTFEVTELPITAAANPWTALDVLQEEHSKMFTPEKREFLTTRFGAEHVATLESSEAAQAKALHDTGVTFKEAAKAEGVEIEVEPAEEEVPMEKPAEGDVRQMLTDMGAMLGAMQEQLTVLAQSMAPMQAEMDAGKAAQTVLAAQVVALTAQAKALQESEDVKIARALNPRVAPAATSATAQGVTGVQSDGAQAALDAVKALSNNQYSWLQSVGPF